MHVKKGTRSANNLNVPHLFENTNIVSMIGYIMTDNKWHFSNLACKETLEITCRFFGAAL